MASTTALIDGHWFEITQAKAALVKLGKVVGGTFPSGLTDSKNYDLYGYGWKNGKAIKAIDAAVNP